MLVVKYNDWLGKTYNVLLSDVRGNVAARARELSHGLRPAT